MNGSTEAMVRYLTDALMKRRISVRQFNMTKTDLGEFASALVDSATAVFGVPTVLFGPHPQIIYTTYLANLLKPKARYAAIIGSFGWGGRKDGGHPDRYADPLECGIYGAGPDQRCS